MDVYTTRKFSEQFEGGEKRTRMRERGGREEREREMREEKKKNKKK